ncbi:MAG: hypothetical protein OIF50_06935 [Flavobacteriaceae bacterium]|nr:hypothetical protein [Flavobacteriaceae bacterium]
MRTRILSLVFIFFSSILIAQVKIGNQPETIDGASILELESENRVLVVTRINSTQMNTITPLRGAVAYNTDTQCVHFYNGFNWINLCNLYPELSNAILTDNSDGTFTFTDNEGNETLFDVKGTLEDNSNGTYTYVDAAGTSTTIDTNKIVDKVTITGSGTTTDPYKVGDLSITSDQLADHSVNSSKILDGSIQSNDIANGAVNTLDLANNSVTTSKIATLGLPDANKVLTTDAMGIAQWETKNNFVSSSLNMGEILVGNFFNQAAGVLPSGDLTVSSFGVFTIEDGAISSNKLANQAIQTQHLEPASPFQMLMTNVLANGVEWGLVNTNNIENLAINNAKIAQNAVGTSKILDLAVTADKIVDDAVNKNKINADIAGLGLVQTSTGELEVSVSDLTGDGSISSTDLHVIGGSNATLEDVNININNNAITTSKLADQAITTAKIADANVTTQKLAEDAVTTDKISNGNANEVLLTNNTADATNWGLVDTDNIASNAVTTAKIADANVTTDKIADLNVTTAKIADDAVTTVKIADANVTTQKLAEDAVTTDKISNGNANEVLLTNTTADATNWGLVDTDNIAPNAITTPKIADANVTTAKIADANVTTDKIADLNVTTTKIADDAVTLAKIGTLGALDGDKIMTTDTGGNPQWEAKTDLLPVKAIGKIAANGTILKASPGITITKLAGNGHYQINLASGMVGDSNYIIMLTLLSRNGSGNDDPNITYLNQSTTSFQVIIGDGDNGGGDLNRYNSEFMFTILDL